MTPTITIGIACFNSETTIEAAVRSAMQQDIQAVDIVVIDDASVDNSVDIVRRLAAEDERIHLVSRRINGGAAVAYNAVIDNASGAYIMFLDADDLALPARARMTVSALEEISKPAFCFCDRYVGRIGGPIVRGLSQPEATPEAFETYMLDAVCLHHAPDFYRTEAWRFESVRNHNLGGSSAGTGVLTASAALLRSLWFDEELRRYCDTEMNLRAAKRGVTALGVSAPLAVQRVTTGSEKSLTKRRKYTSRILAKHEAAFRRFGVVYPGHHHARQPTTSPPVISRAPRATIGLLTFNCEDTLIRAIESARAQTIEDVEILILDDASTDATLEIARSFEDRRIRVIESPWNLGAGANRARLVFATRGEFLAFFDDDDAALPHRVETQIDDLAAIDGPAISIASAFRHHRGCLTEAHRSLGAHSTALDSEQSRRLVWRTILQHSEGKRHLAKTRSQGIRYALGASLMCGRTETFRDFPFDPEMRRMQDLEFLARFTFAGGTLAPTAAPLVDVFVTNASEKRWSIVIEYCCRLLEKHVGTLERVLEISTEEILRRNRERLPAIRAWESFRGAFGY